jgi:hypothetical protein
MPLGKIRPEVLQHFAERHALYCKAASNRPLAHTQTPSHFAGWRPDMLAVAWLSHSVLSKGFPGGSLLLRPRNDFPVQSFPIIARVAPRLALTSCS